MSKAKPYKVNNNLRNKVNNNLRIWTVIKLCAPQDRSGNPQRCWVVINSTPSEIAPLHPFNGNIVTVIDEGYGGWSDVKKFVAQMQKWHHIFVVWGPDFNVSVKEYKETLKLNRGLEHAAEPKEVQQKRKRK